MAAQERELRDALAKLEPKIRRAFDEAIARAALSVSQAELATLIEAGQIEDAVQLLRLDQSLFWPLHEAIRGGYVTGGNLGGKIAPRGLSGWFGFNGRHPRAEAWVQENGAELIQGITEEGVETTRRVIASGLSEGRSSLAVAREITGKMVGKKRVGGYLGLTAQQADSIISGRSKLYSGDPDLMRAYLRLKLRDKRFDKTILKAIREGRAIVGRQLDQIMDAHRSKALGYRGRVIAKHQARQALAAGREEGIEQLRDNPEVETVTARWQHNRSLEPRLDHQAMHGTVIEAGEHFEFPDGTRMRRPHDDGAPAGHTIGCNCMVIYRVRLRRD